MSPTKEAVSTQNAPAPLPQFSQAVKYNGMVYCSGSIGIDMSTKTLAKGGVQPETRAAIKNLSAVLKAAGSDLSNVVKVNVFLTTMDDFAPMNQVYDEFFGSINPKPCRTCVAVHQLPFGAKMEIECTAFVHPSSKL
ncbi:L-psp endoribonuclease family protein [Xylaria bambusicola]|uniref:L-psp endoribonuclease family protein n=1 Tax=Xylaria bambusicola TaxID=326684 RepID=UPI002007CD0E|nr:L-psp endoribonuclease family protein [Xylaria bambusicola]KAI0517053.1 L-psp endoribonuclease family protein [Xylaria bambusicola]